MNVRNGGRHRMGRGVKLFLLILLISAGTIGYASSACYACSCVPPGTVAEEMEKSVAVFAGKVTNMEYTNKGNIRSSIDPVYVTMEVSTVWKGEVGKQIVVRTVAGSESCGFEFVAGMEYVIYAGGGDAERPVVSLCSRTKSLGSASSSGELVELGEGSAPNNDIELNPIPEDPPASSDYRWALYVLSVALLGMVVATTVMMARKRKR